MLLQKNYENENLATSYLRYDKTLTGILMPCRRQLSSGYVAKFKLRTKSGDYYLKLSFEQELFAEKYVWEDIQSVGYLDDDLRIFEVNSMRPIETQSYLPFYLEDEIDVIEECKSLISREGKLDVEYGAIAS